MVGFCFIILGLFTKVSIGAESKTCGIINQYTAKHLIIYTKNNYNFLEDIFDCLDIPVSLFQDEHIAIPQIEESYLILFLFDNFNKTLIAELDQDIDNKIRRKKHIRIIFKFNSCLNNSMVLSLFKTMWKKEFFNMIVVDVTSTVLTYNSFTSHGVIKELDSNTIENAFPDKLKNLHGHEIKVSMFHQIVRSIPVGFRYSGVDGLLAYNLLNHINATAKYIHPVDGQTYGIISESGMTGSLGDIAYGRSDVGFNSRLIDVMERYYVESLYPVYNEIVCVLYPKGAPSPTYLNFIRPFGFSIWAILIISFAFVVSTYTCFRKIVRYIEGEKYYTSENGLISDIELFLKVFLGKTLKEFPRVSSVKIYLMTWILFSYICTTIYFARLESTFVQPAYQKDFDSLSDLLKIEGKIYAPLFFLRIAEENLPPTLFEVVKNKTILVKDMSKVLLLNPPGNSTFLATIQFAKYIIQKTFDYNVKRPAFHISHEYLHTSPFGFYIRNGSPYVEKFDELIALYHEYGFLLYWERMTKLDIFFDNKDLKPENEEQLNDIINDKQKSARDNMKVLTLDILQGAFYLWVIGVCVSLFEFVIEFLWKQKTP